MSSTIMMRTLLLGLLLLSAGVTQAATIQAPTCSRADVGAAYDKTVDGDTLMLPACAQTDWTTQLTVTKCISVHGAGEGKTVIGDALPKDGSGTSSLFSFKCRTGGRWELAHMTLVGIATDPGRFNKGYVDVDGTSKAFRIHHITLVNPLTSFVVARCDCYGLIDHYTVAVSSGGESEGGISVGHTTWGGSDYGDGSWADLPYLGTERAIYVEDSTFINTGTDFFSQNWMDCYGGGRVVFRFNTVQRGNTTSHGTESSGRERGCRSQEIYGNTYTFPGGGWAPFIMWARGGSWLHFLNTVNGGIAPSDVNMSRAAMIRDECAINDVCNFWDSCDGSRVWDQNLPQNDPEQNGYRCIDQPGSGTSVNFGGTAAIPTQPALNASQPGYVWLNTTAGVADNDVRGSTHVQASRDYFTYTAAFTGASGVGSGPRASAPLPCATGVAYWATDEGSWNTRTPTGTSGRLYRCSETGDWALYYTPYVYPHPLQSGDASPLRAPEKFRRVN